MISIVHLIRRPSAHETQAKDFEFSRLSMLEHWKAGMADVETTLAHARWKSRTRSPEGIATYDLTLA
jgi:NTE family protein